MIDKFKGKHAWLSNFWTAPVVLDGVVFPSVDSLSWMARRLIREITC